MEKITILNKKIDFLHSIYLKSLSHRTENSTVTVIVQSHIC